MQDKVSRRGMLASGAAVMGGLALAGCARADDKTGASTPTDEAAAAAPLADAIVPFDGEHQAGIDTPSQAHLNLVGFNLREGHGLPAKQAAVNLMRLWTEDARALCTAEKPAGSLDAELTDLPANLTVTCGWGEGFFSAAGIDKPEWLGDVRAYARDQLRPEWGQTDLVLQICCDDPVTVAHITRHLIRAASAYATPAWMQQGFLNAAGSLEQGQTPRNLFGQKDGTVNPRSESDYDNQVWIGEGEFAGGTAMVVRRIVMNMDTWDEADRASRENSIGRDLGKGAPLSGSEEFDQVDLDARDKYGLRAIDPKSHVARAHPTAEHPEQVIRRRPYNYDLPPTPGDAKQTANTGQIFVCYQKNPRLQFEPIQARLDEADLLNEWITHIGSAMYFVPAGTNPARGVTYWGQHLLEG